MALNNPPVQARPAPPAARRAFQDTIFRGLTWVGALIVLAIVVVALEQLITGSASTWSAHGLQFLTGDRWDVIHDQYGALPLIWGTAMTSLIAIILGGTAGISISAFLVELAPKRLLKPVSLLVDLLAAIPSIIFGLWGFEVLIPWLRVHFYPSLFATFGWTHLFGDTSNSSGGGGLLTAGIALAIMIIPTIAAITREMLLVVPKPMRDGALALGATRTEALTGVQLPYAAGGVLGGLILGLGRALGETMAVTMIIGNSANIDHNLLKPAASLSSMIANNFAEAEAGSPHKSALVALGLVLFVLSLTINIFARFLVMRVRKKVGLVS